MSEIRDWSVSAGSNTAAAPNGWPENTMTFGQLNNTGREMMAVIARWYNDSCGNLAATMPTTNNYVLTASRTITSYTGDLKLRWRVPSTNTGNATLNVNGLGALQIRMPDTSQLRAGDLGDVAETYVNAGGFWVLDNLPRRAVGEFASGVIIVYAMASAPTGWTQLTNWNDRLLRVVSGAGQASGGAWGITGLSTESANHTHTISIGTDTLGAHTHTVSGTTGTPSANSAGFSFGGDSNAAGTSHTHGWSGTSSSSGSHAHTASGTSAGTSNTHSHQGDGTWRPAYSDVIIASKA